MNRNRSNYITIRNLLALLTLGFAPMSGGYADEEFSRANRLLFFEDHMASISEPVSLHYDFTRSSQLNDGFNDSIFVDVTKVNADGTKDASIKYFSGERTRFVPSTTGTRGNPIVSLYLQRDINVMDRATEGKWRYFQKLIKLALEDSATVAATSFEFDGRPVKGKKISIEPFRDDPNRKRYAEYAEKSYEFIVSRDVPGFIYRIHSIAPGAKDADPYVEETLTYRDAK